MSTYARSTFARTDRSIMAQWWWTVDRWTILAIIALIGFGSLMVMAASPAVAVRIGTDSLHFVKRYFLVLPVALALMFSVSLMSPRAIRLICFRRSCDRLGAARLHADERHRDQRRATLDRSAGRIDPTLGIRQAVFRRRLRLALRASQAAQRDFPGNWIAIVLYVLIVGLLIKQPDLGMTAVVSVVWFTQFFLAGLSLIWVVALMGAGIAGLAGAYLVPPARDDPHRPLPRSASRRQLSGRPLDGCLHEWRALGPRSRAKAP